MGSKTPWTLQYLWIKLTHKVTAPWNAQNWSKSLKLGKVPKFSRFFFWWLPLLTKFQPPDMPRNGLKAWSWKKGPKKTLKSPMDPLRVKWWGPKHLGPSYFCELSLPTKFQTSKTSPSFKFWWGNCSCSSSCDRGKTKSTPSLGFRLRLEFDKIANGPPKG